MEKNKLILSVDFDNTCFTEDYPRIGKPIDGAKDTINWLYDMGHTIIINSCREGIYMEEAVSALNRHGFKWHYFNTNDPDRVEHYGWDSRKIGCDIQIDDRDIHVKSNGGVVNWSKTRSMLEKVIHPKKKVVCIVGESGVGKTHMAEYLNRYYDIPMIESYTDRPKRAVDEVGHTFVSKEEFDDLDMGSMIAFTCWKTNNGDIARYCCLESDVRPGLNTYVIDERGLNYLKKYWSHTFTIFAVRMFASEKDRKQRVDEERMSRDKGLFTMPSEAFDYFIENNYSSAMTEKYDRLYERISKL